MSDNIQLNAEPRADKGKGASRRLRRTNRVPAIVYGGDNDPVSISLAHNEFVHELENEAIYTQIIDLKVGKKTEEVILRDLQRHPFKNKIQHADFFRIDKKKPIHVVVPIHVLNAEECVGVKDEGGMLSQLVSETEVVCLPKHLPEYLEIDAKDVHLGDIIHLSELKVPEGVEIVSLTHGEDYDVGILSVVKPRAEEEIPDEVPVVDEDEDAGEDSSEGGETKSEA